MHTPLYITLSLLCFISFPVSLSLSLSSKLLKSHTNMCGGAIISDFVDIKPSGRRLTTEDLWSELDTASDLFGFNSNGALDDFPNSFLHLKAPQKPKQLEKGGFTSFFLFFLGFFCYKGHVFASWCHL